MMTARYRPLLLALALLSLGSASAFARSNPAAGESKTTMTLSSGWRFRQAGKDEWHPATVPGCIHTDLLANKLIEDPFFRDNEKSLQWIGKTDWEYQTTFELTPDILRRQNIELIFAGLDTYADVSLNGTVVLNADNMFRTWRIACKTVLKAGANTLAVRFRSPINEVLPIMTRLNYKLPAPNDQGEKTSPFTRKAPYQFGWDWGPRFVTSGIWRPVLLEAWNEARISDLRVRTQSLSTESGLLTADVEVTASTVCPVHVSVESLAENPADKIRLDRQVQLSPGVNHVSIDFTIQHPQLWWPNGLGPHPLYEFRAHILTGAGNSDQLSVRTGLRTLELNQTADRWGKTFQFVVNGVPVFAKGANWIPADSFPTRVTKDKYRQLIESARDCGMNMLRVWGGGIYENDDFYNLCDEAGILVWQDFMFACSMYPADQHFLDNVRAEATDNVKRLRDHPCLAIWVGNNEIEAAWMHWGWKESLPASLWDDYKKLFNGVLPEVCAALDPSRLYWPSSPSANLEADPESQRMGDLHYWEVRHGGKPFSEYEKQFPRFMSEYGFQSMPQIETVESYTVPVDRDISSPVMVSHQRHPRGNQLIAEYMRREYPAPRDFESFLYVSQILQAEGIKIGAEHLRRIMPRNMGSLYWQLNDCWPGASWSSIDYTGRWKALQYYSRRFYADLLVSPHIEDGNVSFYIVSDRLEPTSAQLLVNLFDFQGQSLSSIKENVEVASLESRQYFSVPVRELLNGHDDKQVFVYCELLVDGKPASANELFFQPYKDLALSVPQIKVETTKDEHGFKIVLSTDKLARGTYLSAPGVNGTFSDNYVDLIPGKKKEIDFHANTPVTVEVFRSQLRVRSLADAFQITEPAKGSAPKPTGLR